MCDLAHHSILCPAAARRHMQMCLSSELHGSHACCDKPFMKHTASQLGRYTHLLQAGEKTKRLATTYGSKGSKVIQASPMDAKKVLSSRRGPTEGQLAMVALLQRARLAECWVVGSIGGRKKAAELVNWGQRARIVHRKSGICSACNASLKTTYQHYTLMT